MDKGNIWENGSFNNLSFDEAVEKYIQYQPKENATKEEVKNFKSKDNGENFSWVLDSDRDKLVLSEADLKDGEIKKYLDKSKLDGKKRKPEDLVCDKSVNWGIPNQIVGDPDEANVFLCLLNPRTRNNISKCTNLEEYINLENKNGGEFFNSSEEYRKHIINDEENILQQEMSRLFNRKLNRDEYQNKVIPMFVKYIDKEIQVDKHKISDDKWKKIKDEFSLGDHFKIILNQEFNKIINNNNELLQLDNIDKLINNELHSEILHEIKRWIGIYKRNVKVIFPEDKKIAITGLNLKLIKIFKSQIESELDPINDSYYFKEYYWKLLNDMNASNSGELIDNIKENKNENWFSNLKICNIELFPYRTIDENGIRFNKGYSYKNLTTSCEMAAIIVKRIKKYEINRKKYGTTKNVKPIFIFRSYSKWEDVIREYLSKNKNVLEESYEMLEGEYFYKYPNEKGIISSMNIKRVRIPKEEYDEIRSKMEIKF